MNINDLQYPTMRAELVYYLDCLQNEEFQMRVWVRGEWETYDEPFGDIIHFLFDDTRLSRDPSFCIGAFLLNEAEADAIRPVTATIDLMVERHGWQGKDADYLKLPEWPAIVGAARRAHALISPGTPPL